MSNNDYGIVPAENKEWLKLQTTETLTPMQVNRQLMILSTAFPTIVRNYDKYEYDAMQQLWYSIFKNVPEELLQEGVTRYIINDRKGFFPSPGQIVGIITDIVKKREMDEFIRERIRSRYHSNGEEDIG